MSRRLLSLAALAAVVLVACGGSDEPASQDLADGDGSCPEGQSLHGGSEDVAEDEGDSSRPFPWERDDAPVREGFDQDRIISGGPPPDGIASIDEPCFGPLTLGDEWLEPQSPVLTAEVNGDARAYPLGIMTQHEIANDVIGGEPVVVTYCPLCNSGLAFRREVDGKVLEFGTSGRLFQANLVMYDRQYKALWVQFTGEAVVGDPWVGTKLERIPTGLLSWEEFKRAHPEGVVLTRATGFDRDYGRNPYPGYEGRGSTFLFEGPTDDRLPPDSRVVGVAGPDGKDATAIPLPLLREKGVVEIDFLGEPLVVWWAPGAASALEADTVAAGGDVGQTGTFRPIAPDGTRLRFEPVEGEEARFTDAETGSTWNIAGDAVAGPLEGETLEEVPRDDTFWFVWFSFRPETKIVGGDS